MIYTLRYRRWYTIFFSILLMLAGVTQPACSTRSPDHYPVDISPGTTEQAEPSEVIIIDGKTFVVPSPWKGNRFTAPEFEYSDFRRIPPSFTHEGSKIYILATAYGSLLNLLQAAQKDGIALKVESAYRSAGYQERIFRRMLAEGRTFEDIVRYVAPPGYSQHMLGTAVDFFPSDWSFAETDAYLWLKENAVRYGFEETYSEFNTMRMPWESWHWNFVGRKVGDQGISGIERKPEE